MPHPWRSSATSDAFSLFVARAAALGWLADSGPGPGGGLWGMNDAGHHATGPGAGPSRVAWFQATLADGFPDHRPLPVQPLLSCAGDVLARLGTLRLSAVRVLLPPRRASTVAPDGPVLALLQEAGWFADTDPRSRAEVRLTLDGGEASELPAAARGMVGRLRHFRQDVFTITGEPSAGGAPDLPPPDLTDALWDGPARHRITLRGALAEWSLDAVGWTAALLAEAASGQAVRSPLMLTLDRPDHGAAEELPE